MKRHYLIVMLCACLLLTACGTGSINGLDPVSNASSTFVPGVDTIVPQAEDTAPLRTQTDAVLYFRYGTSGLLAPQIRTISRTPSQTYEAALINQLTAGPQNGNGVLTGLFPEGTRVLSTVRQGRTLFVTFSGELMNSYDDEPVDWQEDDGWREECPLRRRLCMQSLVATVVANCDVDQVQVLVQQEGASGSLRLKQNYFLDDSMDSVLVGPMTADSSLLIGPDKTMELILNAWSMRDWQTLYALIAMRDPVTGASHPSQREFISRMEQLPVLTAFRTGDASFSADLICATYLVDCTTMLASGGTEVHEACVIRIYYENGLWKTTMDQLTGWLEAD